MAGNVWWIFRSLRLSSRLWLSAVFPHSDHIVWGCYWSNKWWERFPESPLIFLCTTLWQFPFIFQTQRKSFVFLSQSERLVPSCLLFLYNVCRAAVEENSLVIGAKSKTKTLVPILVVPVMKYGLKLFKKMFYFNRIKHWSHQNAVWPQLLVFNRFTAAEKTFPLPAERFLGCLRIEAIFKQPSCETSF